MSNTPSDAEIRGLAAEGNGVYQDDETAVWEITDPSLIKFARAVLAKWGTPQPAEQQAAPKAAPGEPVNGWPVEATIYKRRDEWVLELSGTINDCAFTCRHTQPGYLQPEDVAGLPSLYSEGIAPQQEAQEPVGQYLTVVYRDLTRDEAQALIDHEKMSAASWSHALHERDMAKAAPKPAPAPLSYDVVKDAVRYRWLRDSENGGDLSVAKLLSVCDEYPRYEEVEWYYSKELDAAIDAAIAAQGGRDAG